MDRLLPFHRYILPWLGMGLVGLLTACSALPGASAATPLQATATPWGPFYTHPSHTFALPVPAGWQVVAEDEVSVRLEPLTPDTDKRWVEMTATFTGIPLSPDALKTFARRFAADSCPTAQGCEVHRARESSDGEVAVGMRYVAPQGEELHLRFTFRQADAVVYSLTAASTGRGVLRDFQHALWQQAQLHPEQASNLPLYGAHHPYALPLHAIAAETGPYVVVEVPKGWGLSRVDEVEEEAYYAYALAASPDGVFALGLYTGHPPGLSPATVPQVATAQLQSLFHIDALRIEHQEVDAEGRWLLTWQAKAPNIQAVTLAALHENELVLITGVAPTELWPLAAARFHEIVTSYRLAPTP
ncbi:MAG: hypothetical protein GXO37_02200 [Chloroflexi bacterium]|nr:hypothetical protein [Chloroflexota bacterium]